MKTVTLGPYTVFYEDDETFKHMLGQGENYEPHLWGELKKSLATCRCFLDLGCNVGFYTVMAKWFRGFALRTISMDPNKSNCACLLNTIHHNGIENADVIPFGAANFSGLVYGTKSWNTGLSPVRINGDWNSMFWVVRVDDLPISPPDVIKMDVEGFELFALLGMRRLIGSNRPTVFFEYNLWAMGITETNPIELLEFFVERDYTLAVLDYKPGMFAEFRNAKECADHIAKFGEICDIMAKPI